MLCHKCDRCDKILNEKDMCTIKINLPLRLGGKLTNIELCTTCVEDVGDAINIVMETNKNKTNYDTIKEIIKDK